MASWRPAFEHFQAVLVPAQNQAPDKASRLVKSKKMRQNILDHYLEKSGANKPIVSPQVGIYV